MVISLGGVVSATVIDWEDSGRVLIVTLLVGDGVAIVSDGLGGNAGFAESGCVCGGGGAGEASAVSVMSCGAGTRRSGSTLSLSPLSLSLARFLS